MTGHALFLAHPPTPEPVNDWDAIVSVTNPWDLLLEYGVEEYIEEEVDIPLYSDVFYTYITSSQRGLAAALRKVMLARLE